MAETAPEDTAEWYDVLGRFRAKVAEFTDFYNRLVSIDVSGNPELSAERDTLLSAGTTIRDNVLSLTQSVDEAYAWLKSTIGLGAIQDSNFGAIPLLIPVAAAAVAVAAMTKWISDAIVYFDKADRWQAIAAEHGADAANKAIAAIDAPFLNIGDMTKALLPFVFIAGGIYFFRDKIFK